VLEPAVLSRLDLPMGQSPGTLLVLSGPSGVGKTTIAKRLRGVPGITRVMTTTTRARRPQEVDGRDYRFLSRADFEAEIAAGAFLEHAEIDGNRYGTPKAEIERKIAEGALVLVDIDPQGAKSIRALGLPAFFVFVEPPDMAELLAVPSLWQRSGPELPAKQLGPKVLELAEKALDQLVATRQREGASIDKDLRARLDAVESCAARVRTRVPSVVDAYQKKLDERVRALLAQKGLEVAKADLAKEVAVYADRCDVSEEVQRLHAHVAEFRKVTATKGAIGRRLDFLTQEMGREANTIASKGNDAEVSAAAVEIKSELEKIKEQVENVE